MAATSCVATVAPGTTAAQRGLNGPSLAADTQTPDASTCSSSSSTHREVSAAKPTPKANFTAPKMWMVAFGVALAACAGSVDAVTARNLHVFVSHVTGTVARVGMQIEGVTTGGNDYWDVIHSVLLVISFIFGSFLCGLGIPKNQVHFGGKSFYGVALLGNSCLLIAAGCIAPTGQVDVDHIRQPAVVVAACLAATACGLQNAMCTMHFGAIVRTTHVTGTATDIGSTAGRGAMLLLMSGCKPRHANEFERAELRDDAMKLFVLVPIFLGFLCGSILGACLDTAMGIHALFVPAMFTATTGLMYTFFRTQMKQQLKKLEERRLKDELGEMEAVLHRTQTLLETTGWRAGRDNLEEIDGIIGSSLMVVHDVEATLAELCGRPGADTTNFRARTI